MRATSKILASFLIVASCLFLGCTPAQIEGSWDVELQWNEDLTTYGVLKITNENGMHAAILNSFQLGKLELQNLAISGSSLSGNFEKWDDDFTLEGRFSGDTFKGSINTEDQSRSITATRQSNKPLSIDRSGINYILSKNDLEETELNIDHFKLIEDSGQEAF